MPLSLAVIVQQAQIVKGCNFLSVQVSCFSSQGHVIGVGRDDYPVLFWHGLHACLQVCSVVQEHNTMLLPLILCSHQDFYFGVETAKNS